MPSSHPKPKQHRPLTHPIFDEPIFAEATVTPDPRRFSTRHPSDNAQYKTIEDLLTKDTVSFDRSRAAPGDLYDLTTALGPHGPRVVGAIRQNDRIVFHAVGDTGASDVRKYANEVRVFDQVAQDCHTAQDDDRPSFLFHLGDVIYNFGEARYYYDQFYEPNRNYPGPIFAIAGNHDSFILPGTPAEDVPLAVFCRNFCAEGPGVSVDAGSLHRTAMTQPGVYFALDAPFVRIIGLFSNALEDPGALSSEGGRWAGVPDLQLEFLAAQLAKVRDDKYEGALLVAVHHSPFVYNPKPGSNGPGAFHVGSTDMLRDIDTACQGAGIYPHAVLSAHAHNYQRYTRTIRLGGRDVEVPFIVCGGGGHNLNPLVRRSKANPGEEPSYGADVSYLEDRPAVEAQSLILEKYNDQDYGYLRITADAKQLSIGFHVAQDAPLSQSRFDMVTVDLASRALVAN